MKYLESDVMSLSTVAATPSHLKGHRAIASPVGTFVHAFVRNDEKGLVAMLLPKLLITLFMIYCYPLDIDVICYNTRRQSRKTKLPRPCETMHIPG